MKNRCLQYKDFSTNKRKVKTIEMSTVVYFPKYYYGNFSIEPPKRLPWYPSGVYNVREDFFARDEETGISYYTLGKKAYTSTQLGEFYLD